MTEEYIHTDSMGVPVRCAACGDFIYYPAVKIADSFKKTTSEGPWEATWQVEYYFYHYECARKHLSKDRPWWKFW